MPIRVNCQCGKSLNVKDEMAGKAIKCPGCANVIRVPAPGAASAPAPVQPAPAQRATPMPAAPVGANPMEDLFDEEGFDRQVVSACPACGENMAGNAVFCTKCGYNKQTGERLESHKLAGIDIDYGELALMKAEDDMHRDKKAQKEMLKRAGLPWWGLGLVLFTIGSATTIAVIAVNASRREDESLDFNPMQTFLLMAGIAFSLVALGMVGVLIQHAIKKDATKAQIWKLVIGVVVLGGIAGGLFAGAANQ